jgi:catalase
MTPVEKEHIVLAYTFELGKCYEQAVKERQLQCLANIDAELCAQVATGLGLPAPDPTLQVPDAEPSPALSQLGGEWPPDGRLVGIVVDPGSELDGVERVRRTLLSAGALPLVIGPHGGEVDGTVVQRTFATVRSVELDAVLVAGAAPPAPDAVPARDSKAGAAGAGLDPRVSLLLDEAFRHAKVIGAWGDGQAAVAAMGLDGAPGVVVGDDAESVLTEVQALMAGHRVWERFPARL